MISSSGSSKTMKVNGIDWCSAQRSDVRARTEAGLGRRGPIGDCSQLPAEVMYEPGQGCWRFFAVATHDSVVWGPPPKTQDGGRRRRGCR